MRKLILSISSIFLLSFSVILLEISLSRYFSYILSYHFVFIIIAFSLLGLAIGQMLFARNYEIISSNPFKFYFLTVLTFIGSVAIIFYLPSSEVFSSGSLGLLSFMLFSIIPFIFIGILFGYIFQSNNLKSGIIYAFDLFGGAAAAVLANSLLDNLNLVNVFMVVFVFMLIATLLESLHLKKNRAVFASAIGIILIFAVFLIIKNYDIDFQIVKSLEKDLVRIKTNPGIRTEKIESKWNSFGKTDLVNFTYPDGTTSESMFIDGAAGTEVVDISKLEKDTTELKHKLMHFAAYFPFYFLNEKEKDSALIIGPGGGIDIAAAYFGKTKYIKAVEVNPTFVELMKKYNPSTFTQKENIEVITGEGRNFVKTTGGKFDLIFLTIPVTKGNRSVDFINLTENYLFTVEALDDYLKILTDEGRIAFTLHNEEEVFKILSNYLSLKETQGISQQEALKSIYIISNGMMPLIVIKKMPFQKEEIVQRHILAHKLNYDKSMLFFPYIEQVRIDTLLNGGNKYNWTMFNQIVMDISEGKYNFHRFSEMAAINLHPVYDNTPFFFNFELGLPQNSIILVFILIILLFLLYPAFRKYWFVKIANDVGIENHGRFFNNSVLLVLLINISDIFFQAYLFQKLNLKLNNPVKSFSLLLFAFLLGSGLGSFLTAYFKSTFKVLYVSIISIIAVSLVELLIIIPLSANTNKEYILYFVVLLPSFFIGLPFPLILRRTAEYYYTNGNAILLCVSGIGYFIGSIITIITAIIWGFNILMFLAVLTNVVTILILSFQSRLNAQLV